MAWVTPKTDWKIQLRDSSGRYNGDWFNLNPDYYRIKGNLEYLADRVGLFFDVVTEFVALPSLTNTSLVYFDDVNRIEQNLIAINKHLPKPLSLVAAKTWAGNGLAPTVADLNRIESGCLRIYEAIPAQAKLVWKIPFHMGGRRL